MTSALGLFSRTVPEAEDRFAAACAAAGAPLTGYVCPERGRHGEELTVGVARLGPTDAGNVLLMISATHGIEGYAGSAIQCGLLAEAAAGALTLPDDTAVVLVHLINPWGVAWDRRETEENIDCFRNVLYCDEPSPTDPIYAEIEEALNFRVFDGAERARADAELAAAVERHGFQPVHWAIRRGQHDYPKGMSYHGNGPAWSTRTMRQVVDRELAGARRVAVIDVHTGFGPPAHGTCIVYSPRGGAATERLSRWHGELYLPADDPAIPTHSTRLPYEWVSERIPGAETTFVSLEFGTFSNKRIIPVLQDSSHFHNYGDLADPRAADVNAAYRRFFYPDTDEWKAAVWRRGLEVTDQTLDGLAAWAKED